MDGRFMDSETECKPIFWGYNIGSLENILKLVHRRLLNPHKLITKPLCNSLFLTHIEIHICKEISQIRCVAFIGSFLASISSYWNVSHLFNFKKYLLSLRHPTTHTWQIRAPVIFIQLELRSWGVIWHSSAAAPGQGC